MRYILLFSALITSANIAQSNPEFKYLTTEDGFAYNYATCFCEDQFGFLWIGYEGGLDRYDGNTFLHFTVDPLDSNSLPDPFVEFLHLDKKNRLWVATHAGLVRFDYDQMNFKKTDPGLKTLESEWVQVIEETNENGEVVLWLSLMNAGMVKYYPDKNEAILFTADPGSTNSLSDNIILDIHADGDNIIWIATLRGGLNRFDPVNERFKIYRKNEKDANSINDNHIISIASEKKDGKKIIWLGTGKGGLNKFDNDSETFYHYTHKENDPNSLSHNRVLSIQKYKEKLLLGTAGGGLNIFDPHAKRFERYYANTTKGSISSDIITDIYKTSYDFILFGTFEGGISYIDELAPKFHTVRYNETDRKSISAKSVLSLARINNGDIYLGYTGGINIIRNNDSRVLRIDEIPILNDLLKDVMVITLFSSLIEKGVIWIGTFNNGLIKYNYLTQSYKKYVNDPGDPGTISHNTITALYEDRNGYLWFGGQINGLNKMNIESGIVQRYSNRENNNRSLSNNIVSSLYEDSEGVLWISTEYGLNKYNEETDDFDRFYFDEENIHTNTNLISTVTEGPKDKEILWVSTAAGLIKFSKKSGVFTRFTIRDGLSSNLIMSVLSDNKNSIWMNTVSGISKFNTGDQSIINFNKEDGVEINEFNLGCFYKDNDGYIFYGGTSGITYFHPDSINIPDAKNKVLLTDFYLLNNRAIPGEDSFLDSSITLKKKLTLDYSHYVFGIEFTAPDYRSFEKQKFQYMLAGFNNEWITAHENNRVATFTNIPPGEYEFKVKVSNRFGKWNENYSSLMIEITPPFWKTWWAYSIYFIVIAGALFGFVEYRSFRLRRQTIRLQSAVEQRTKELKQLNADKDRFFSIVAHDIKSPLVALVRFTDIFKKQFTGLNEDEKVESIKEINDTLHNTYKYLTNLLNWSRVQIGKFEFNPVRFDLRKLIDENIDYVCAAAQTKNIEIVSDVDDETNVYADYEMISIVLRNLLSNAIKFSYKGSSINVSTNVSKDVAVVTVEDSGIGISEDKLAALFNIDNVKKTRGTENEEGTGLGLILCKELINKNNGEIFAESKIGAGSKFSFTLPL